MRLILNLLSKCPNFVLRVYLKYSRRFKPLRYNKTKLKANQDTK
jgi:hypothetical protein